jgi:hypothetical protein
MPQGASQLAAKQRVWPSAPPEASFEHNRVLKWAFGNWV